MPITPFHLIAIIPIKTIAPKHFSWSVFALTNIIIDLEPITLYLITLEPRHLFFHTIIGATLIAILCATFGKRWCEIAIGIWNEEEKMGGWTISDTYISRQSAWSGALIGAWSHLLLDSFMHDDITPLSPFTQANYLLGKISISQLHFICVGFGVIGLILIMISKLKKH